MMTNSHSFLSELFLLMHKYNAHIEAEGDIINLYVDDGLLLKTNYGFLDMADVCEAMEKEQELLLTEKGE